MKNTVITARRKKIELLTLLVCFIIGNLANLYAIISYKTPFSEMLTSIFYVLAFSCVPLPERLQLRIAIHEIVNGHSLDLVNNILQGSVLQTE